MVKRALLIAVCAFLTAGAVEAGSPPNLQPRHDAAVDGDGILWGLSGYSNGNYADHLITYQDGAWRDAAFTKPQGAFEPAMLRQGPGGSVLCFWKARYNQYLITKHRANRSAEVVGLIDPGGVNQDVLSFVDSRGDAWITGHTPKIVRIRAEGVAEEMYRYQPEELQRFHVNNQDTYNPILCQEDSAGQLWFGALFQASNAWTASGLLKFDGTTFQHVGRPKNLPEKACVTYFAPVSKGRLWLAITGPTGNLPAVGGLLEYDLESGLSSRVPEPEPNAFWKVQYLASLAGSTYISAETTGSPRGFNLWRLREGVWTKLLKGYNPLGQSGRGWQQSIQQVPGGVVISGDRETPWFASDDGSCAVQLDWRAGLPMEIVLKFLALGKDQDPAIGGDHPFMGELRFPPARLAQGRVQEITLGPTVISAWSIDAKEHVWACLERNDRVLSEWTGNEWRTHEIPTEVRSVSYVRVDTRGRVWVLPEVPGRSAAFYESPTGKWRTRANTESLFESTLGDLPVFMGTRPAYEVPDAAPDGRRMAFSRRDEIVYFDGAAWRRWKLTEIRPGTRFWLCGAPFFTSEGLLCVSLMSDGITESTWGWEESKGWKPCEIANRFPDPDAPGPHQGQAEPKPALPKESVTRKPDSEVVDNRGIIWFTWRGALYRAVPGACEPVFPEGTQHPFRDGRALVAAWVDTRGNAFLETYGVGRPGANIHCMIPPQGSLPVASVSIAKTAPDCIHVTLRSDLTARQFRVQFDDKPWQSVMDGSYDLDFLTPGPHRIKAFALDEHLQPSASAGEANIDIVIDPAAQIDGIIGRLRDPSFARREIAVAALVQRGHVALAPLKKARASEKDAGVRWWMDVAIQEIERSPAD